MRRISRRRFLQQGSLAAATVAGTGLWGRSAWSEKTPESAQLTEFGYSDILMASDPHESQLMNTHAVLMMLNEDSLLKPLRQMSGMPRQARTWAGGITTIPITTTAQISTLGLLLHAPLGNGCRR